VRQGDPAVANARNVETVTGGSDKGLHADFKGEDPATP